MELQDFTIRILIALGLGLAIGLERQIQHKNAGIRTNGLVALGSAIYVLLSLDLTDNYEGDVTRIVAHIVVGVGFLCAGVIFHQGMSVQGLTTAATIWCSAGIGCLAATGNVSHAIVSTIIVIVVNAILRVVDHWVDRISADKKED